MRKDGAVMQNNPDMVDKTTEENAKIDAALADACSNSEEKFPVAPLPEEIPLPLPLPMRSSIASNFGPTRFSSTDTNSGGGGYGNSVCSEVSLFIL